MIKINFKTNLDLYNESWPTIIPALPNIGDYIESRTKHKNGFRLVLQVTRITWKYSDLLNYYVPCIELHMTDWQKRLQSKDPEACQGSITAFYEWYAPKVGKTVGSFI